MNLLCLLAAVSVAGSPTPSRSNPTYIECPTAIAQATQVADVFLWAWATCDRELGLQLLSRELYREVLADSTGWFDTFMSGTSNPHHMGFELTGGKLLSATRATFTVSLLEHYQGEPSASRHEGTIELVREPTAGAGPDSLLRPRVHRLTEPLDWRVAVIDETSAGLTNGPTRGKAR
jgi:hypothetical protein